MLPVISRLARFACSPHRTRTCLPRLGMIVTGACQGGALLPFALPRALLSSSGLNRRCVQEDWDGEEIHPIWPPVMDHCEEALDPSCQDLDVIATVLVAIPPPPPHGGRALTRLLHVWGQEEVDDEEFEHPVVDALINKQEALEAYLSGKKQTNEVLTGRADGI